MQDLHCHLTTGEVVGYLGGRWDSESYSKGNVIIKLCIVCMGNKSLNLHVVSIKVITKVLIVL